jgi:hypothetical protein
MTEPQLRQILRVSGPRPPRLRHRNNTNRAVREALTGLLTLSVFITCCISVFIYLPPSWGPIHVSSSHQHSSLVANQLHPIQHLMEEAQKQRFNLLAKQTTHLFSTIQAYTRARGRDPPPGFNKWFQYAQKHNAIVVEELFDQIHDDLKPFWDVSANDMRSFAGSFEDHISIRNGSASMTTRHTDGPGRKQMERCMSLMKEVESFCRI